VDGPHRRRGAGHRQGAGRPRTPRSAAPKKCRLDPQAGVAWTRAEARQQPPDARSIQANFQGAVTMHGRVYDDILQLVGRTPIVRLSRLQAPDEANSRAKIEFFSPAGSVKDRIGLAMIEDAEKSGKLRKGMTIVEPTS